MTTEPLDPGDPVDQGGPDDLDDSAEGDLPSTPDLLDQDAGSDDSDAMGIDDDDPIDATLVGKPVDTDETDRSSGG